MEIAINKCYGGFSLSPKAVARLAELQGRECYFFKNDINNDEFIPITLEDCYKIAFWIAFDVPNPPKMPSSEEWSKLSNKKKEEWNNNYKKFNLSFRDIDRGDPLLIQVIKELGNEANGSSANIKIIEIPESVDWEIEEYDGMEHVAEKHRTWG